MVVHGVQHVFHPGLVYLRDGPSEDRRTKLVVIARDLDRELQASFSALGLEAV